MNVTLELRSDGEEKSGSRALEGRVVSRAETLKAEPAGQHM